MGVRNPEKATRKMTHFLQSLVRVIRQKRKLIKKSETSRFPIGTIFKKGFHGAQGVKREMRGRTKTGPPSQVTTS